VSVSARHTIPTCRFIMFSIPEARCGSFSFGMMPLTFCDAQHNVVLGSIHVGLFIHVLLKRESPPILITFGATILMLLLIYCHAVIIDASLTCVDIRPKAT
jgi:hypothetical protein